MAFGDPNQRENLMLTRSQWEGMVVKEKKSSAEGSGSSTKKQNNRGDDRDQGKKGNHGNYEHKANSKPKFDKKRIKCYNCGMYRHFKSECLKPKKEKAFVAEKGDDDPALLMAEACELMENREEVTELVTLVKDNVHLQLEGDNTDDGKVWYLDTGASNHMTGCKKQFTELNTSVSGSVKFSDGSTVSIAGRGTMLFEEHTGEHKALTDVYYIPRLTSNIIS